MKRILVAGATGALGRYVVESLRERGMWVRVLSRSPERAKNVAADEVTIGDALNPSTITRVCDGIDTVFSCLGQSVGTDMSNRGPGYHDVDYVGNVNLLASAKAAGVKRFVYVSVFGDTNYPDIRYYRAHADAAATIRQSGLEYAIIKPTGFFSAYAAFFEMARAGQAVLFGDGSARTNPIHDADLAVVCADAVMGRESGDVPAGGPTVHTRREVFEIAFKVLNQPPRITRAPTWVPYLMSTLARPFAPRISDLMQFFGSVGGTDAIAPVRGTRELGEYFEHSYQS